MANEATAPQSQNEIDNALIAEWEATDVATDVTEGETAKPDGLETLIPDTAPDPAAEPAPEPITAAAVAGDKPAAAVAPDAHALRDRLQGLSAPPVEAPADTRDAELATLREAVSRLSQGQIGDPVEFLKHQTGLTPEQLIAQQQAPESVADRALERAQAAIADNAALREQLAGAEKEKQLSELRHSVVSFVSANEDTFPLLNTDDNQGLVFAQMEQSLVEGTPMSETEAATHVEGSLREYVEKAAAKLGYTKGDVVKAVETSESPTLTPGTAGSTVAADWDTMSDEARDAELLKML